MNQTPTVETILAQAGRDDSGRSRAFPADVPIGVTYARDEQYATAGPYAYLRDQGSPGIDRVEQVLARLEGGRQAVLFSSGLAASAAAFSSLPAGSRVVVPDVMYFGLTAWLRRFGTEAGLDVVEVPTGDLEALRSAVAAAPTALVWVETPANPTWVVTDIGAAADIAHAAGALLGVDNTVATPVHCNPLALGADVVMHSATKYLNGHDDVVAGALVLPEPTSALAEHVASGVVAARRLGGAVPGGLEVYLLTRGLRTLAVRMEAVSRTALSVAEHFDVHPLVERVAYPGLLSDPGHEVAAKQMHGGFSGMLSLFVRGDAQDALAVANATRVFIRATSLGGTASLIEHRFTFEGPGSRSPRNMLRISVGLEPVGDLVDDLEQALDRVLGGGEGDPRP
ncbi:MAG TPA: PLP-dependent aspartate aminotransferase family protein [Kineosporiaceae bacterium]